MLKDVLNSSSINRLRGIIQSRYGKQFVINSLITVTGGDALGDESFQVQGEDLKIPIWIEQRPFATAMVKEVSDLNANDHQAITNLVKMVVEPELYRWHLEQVTNNSKARVDLTNVVSIFNPATSFENEEITDESLSARLICLQSQYPSNILRMSHEIHSVSERWAFLRFSDIQSQVQNAQDIISLGSLTLVIHDVLELSPQHQELIYRYLLIESNEQAPLFVIGSASSVESLEEQGIIHEGLAHLLKTHRLEIDRLPRDEKLLHQALEFMLEN